MATVYLARLSGVAGFSRLVAIKRLHPHLAREQEFIDMFLDEARLAARIHHPNVVPIQEVGESGRGYYLVMDYIEGDTLARVLQRASQAGQPVPYSVTIRVLLDVLAGLHAAHELKDDLGQPLSIVHRDVSPQNIIVGVDGIARIVDFGVARAASRLATTRSGQLKGKLAYMAPEQALGSDIDRRADLFSCGIVLWESLAMKRLFKGDGEAGTLNKVLYEPIAPPSTYRNDIPRPLEDVCMKALARDAKDRFATAQDLADALETAARKLSCVGSVRDVAQCLDSVVGADLNEQRDQVRAWLASSEPSGPSMPRPSTRPKDSLVTKVEGATRERSEPQAPPSSAVTGPAPPPSAQPPAPTSASSVSAVLSVDAPPPPVQPASTPARSRGTIVIVAAVAALVAGVAVWGATKYPRPTPTTASIPAPPAPSAEPPKKEEAPTPTAASADHPPVAPSTSPATSISVEAPATKPKPRPKTPAARPSTAPTAPADDLSKNPYR